VPPFQIGAVLDGGSVGQVVASRHPAFAEGDFVVGMQGFREYYKTDGGGQRKIDPALGPLSPFLGRLGMPGLTAYRGADLERAIAEHCPQGVDIYFENVGGAMLEAALASMRPFGRIPLCGMIALYNQEQPQPGPRNLILAIPRRLTLAGFILSDHFDRLPAFTRDVAGWLRQGRIKNRETIVQGIANAPAAFIGLLRGENVGKMLVQVGPDPMR
jgi:NADPH-dependent curcumin reductase CurA